LKPGLSESGIAHIIAPTGVRLPAEAIAFYSHFNLPRGYQYSADQPTFFGIYWLLGLEDAIDQYGVRRSIGYFEKQESFWFPILQDDANYYLLDTARINGNACPIIESANFDAPQATFVSLEAMFDTMYYWVEDGVLAIESGHIAGDYEGHAVQASLTLEFRVGQLASNNANRSREFKQSALPPSSW
jgi:hypothetical protein